MGLFFDILERLPVSGPLRYLLLVGVSVIGMLGYRVAAPGDLLPITGGEYIAQSPAVGPFDGSTVFERRINQRMRLGDRVGLREFHVREGQDVVFQHRFKGNCGYVFVSIDFAGALKDLPPRSNNTFYLRNPGQGSHRFTAPESGVYRVFSRPYGKKDCGKAWLLTWHVESPRGAET
ncbi:MAG: hypothetical protein AAFQ84_08460 [Pseudomonadota bacterium]